MCIWRKRCKQDAYQAVRRDLISDSLENQEYSKFSKVYESEYIAILSLNGIINEERLL